MSPALKFLPAMLFLPVWLTIALREGLLVPSFRAYYPLALAMIVGSLVAGSTPLGGGVVAFPVGVLVLGWTPSQGRDFSLAIQSCGMTAASFLIATTRPAMVRRRADLMAKTIASNVLGLVAGSFFAIPPFAAMCAYTTSVSSFAIILAYVEICLGTNQEEDGDAPGDPTQHLQTQVTTSSTPSFMESYSTNLTQGTASGVDGAQDQSEVDNETLENNHPISKIKGNQNYSKQSTIRWMNWALIFIFGFVGGVISSQIGTGSDMAWYAYGSLIHNSRGQNTTTRIGDNDLTAISVVVMTVTSIFGTLLRATSTGADATTVEVYHAFIACSCIVVLGAPIGSSFLTANHRRRLKGLFYLLAFFQLALFGAIKIRDDAVAWAAVCGSLGAIVAAIVAADWFFFGRKMGGRLLHYLCSTKLELSNCT